MRRRVPSRVWVGRAWRATDRATGVLCKVGQGRGGVGTRTAGPQEGGETPAHPQHPCLAPPPQPPPHSAAPASATAPAHAHCSPRCGSRGRGGQGRGRLSTEPRAPRVPNGRSVLGNASHPRSRGRGESPRPGPRRGCGPAAGSAGARRWGAGSPGPLTHLRHGRVCAGGGGRTGIPGYGAAGSLAAVPREAGSWEGGACEGGARAGHSRCADGVARYVCGGGAGSRSQGLGSLPGPWFGLGRGGCC